MWRPFSTNCVARSVQPSARASGVRFRSDCHMRDAVCPYSGATVGSVKALHTRNSLFWPEIEKTKLRAGHD